ncbi:ROK family protein [Paenibacillus sp. TRM 82003]|uniref:ROK family protein n=1 Tax=Kineococcus sp. TRM81007 TaxID=2925831 RepID=UPI001F5A5A85|nr:ROK family protein [Kineococcus sp. TRM81007]MCI2240119.1 ROK family protein [Kineococcus sp. TRM81007]MCI3925575.1 ROK family protein [Paenibacillus sp. TRM 82003]
MSGSRAGTAAAVRRLREENLRAVLEHAWDAPGEDGSPTALTGSDLMGATGLSRATVHDVCEELIERGWLHELANARTSGAYVKGRPARRYAFAARAGVVVGVDAGVRRLSATVADLRGEVLGGASATVEHDHERTSVAERLAALESTALAALADAGAAGGDVLAAAVGVPAPVAADGRTAFAGNPYWEFTNPGISTHLHRRFGWHAVTDNDANLAALAEDHRGHGRGVRHHVTLLAGERFGAGVVEDGRLLRGARGGAGEMRYLDLVSGVGSTDGVAKVLRELARARGGRGEAEQVLTAARDGDRAARALVRTAGLRLTRVVATLAGFADPERIVLAGAVAASAEPLLEVVRAELPRFLAEPRPQVVASGLGADVVVLGAVERAVQEVRARALELVPDR